MTDVARCLTDGYSTIGTSGTGLGAVRRLADDFDIHSVPGEGTIVLARFGRASGTPHDKKLSQILRNFISNALKFTPVGEVRVCARVLDGEMVEFAVTDTGIGIAAEHLPNLFADFVQLDVKIQKRLRGSGLGLSLARKFADLLNGSVCVTSELGKGSRFSVVLPMRLEGATEKVMT